MLISLNCIFVCIALVGVFLFNKVAVGGIISICGMAWKVIGPKLELKLKVL